MRSAVISGIWLLLIALTLFSYGISLAGYSGKGFVALLLFTAFLKGRWIINDFMMLRKAPRVWGLLLTAWLLIILLVIGLLYFQRG